MKIAFAGYGIEAESAYHYFNKRFPEAEFAVYESRPTPKKPLPDNVVFFGNTPNFHNIDADVVVRTPSVAPDRITTTGRVTSVTDVFFTECKLPIIGVTGTKGKGTTSSLIAKMLDKANIKTWLVGNIGFAALDALDEVNAAESGVVIYELSSFQLWDLQQSPHVAVILRIEPEHLDVHGTFENYVEAKANITAHQTAEDVVVYYAPNGYSQQIAERSTGRKVAYNGMTNDSNEILFKGEVLLKADETGLRGAHNLENINAALTAASEFTDDKAALAAAIREFKGLPHRLEELGKRNGVLYVNDNFSSAPSATLAAVRAYTEPITLIMGGYDRGIDLEPLVTELVAEKQLTNVLLIGQTGPKLKELFITHGFEAASVVDGLDSAFAAAQSGSAPGSVVIMSPGCASFDMFNDFTERGEAFKSLVNGVQREFVFERYEFDNSSLEARFHYSFDGYDTFIERVVFDEAGEYDNEALQRALFLAFILIGTSYCKLYPGARVALRNVELDEQQAAFLNAVYQEGMSQYAYENGLTRDDLAHFTATVATNHNSNKYNGNGVLSLQSGGKDSLLTAKLLEQAQVPFDSFYIASRGKHYPGFIDTLPGNLHVAERLIDLRSLKKHAHSGGLSGHVPITYIVLSLALIQAVLLNKNTVVVSIGHEGEEPHEWIDDLPVSHQWSKTWRAEQLIADYVSKYVSEDIRIGSPLRRYTELRIAELFIENAWGQYGHLFSSCNVANYTQGNDNTTLTWCGDCPKCANSFLLFAPFMDADELKSIFAGQDLFAKPSLVHTFEGLLGVNGVMKPFECVGEVDELRFAYHLAQQRGGYETVSFDVPASQFDYQQEYPAQAWTTTLFSI